MHDSNYQDDVILDPVINAEWKAMNQEASRVSVNNLPGQRHFCDWGKSREHFVKKLVPQPC